MHAIVAPPRPGHPWTVARAWLSGAPGDRFRAMVFAAFLLLLGAGVATHEMWRDEMQAWLIARDSTSLASLFRNMRYEGHPALWYLLLMPLTWLGRSPLVMAGAHATIAAGATALVLWRGPFSRLELLLLPFGYVMLFEYGVKSRSYVLGALLLFGICALWARRRERMPGVAVLLALLANVHVLFTIIAIAMSVTLVVDRLRERGQQPLSAREGAAALLVAGALLIATVTAVPPSDSVLAAWTADLEADHLLHTLTLIGAIVSVKGLFTGFVGLTVLLIGCWRWRDCPAAAVFLATSAVGLLTFFHVKFPGFVWHHGVLLVVVLAATWIGRSPSLEPGHAAAQQQSPGAVIPRWLLQPVLAVQAALGIVAVADDIRLPYSQAVNVAAWVTTVGLRSSPIVADNDLLAVPLVGYLGVDRMLTPRGDRWFSFVTLDRARVPRQVSRTIERIRASGERPTIIMAPGDADTDPWPLRLGYVEVARFITTREGRWRERTNEDYVIFRPMRAAAVR